MLCIVDIKYLVSESFGLSKSLDLGIFIQKSKKVTFHKD